MKVPFIDLQKQYISIQDEVDAAIGEIVRNSNFTLGESVSTFEKSFARFCGTKYARGVASGTAALHLSLLALGIRRGDEVITVPNSFIATADAIVYTGATPVFVDIDPATYTLNPSAIESAITPRTKAILVVHLYGHAADMDAIQCVANKHGLVVFEDACQAHGTEYKGKHVGRFGAVAAFSFYPSKNLGAYGEAGCVVTDRAVAAQKIEMLRNHGQKKKYHHEIIGYNYLMDSIHASILSVKLRYLHQWITARRKHAALYNVLLSGIADIACPYEAPFTKHSYHLYVVRVPRRIRDSLYDHLRKNGIDPGIHYPIPIHLQQSYSFCNIKRGTYPVTEQYAEEIISLPIFPELTEEQIHYVVEKIRRFFL